MGLPPLEKVPPFWTVAAGKLNAAPDWARRRMFGHASQMIQIVSVNGGILDGRQLYGKKRLMVYWDWGDRVEEGNAVAFMQVLQKAQADLQAKGVEIMFTHVMFPTGRKQPMNDSDLRAWADKWSVKDGGQKAPMIISTRGHRLEGIWHSGSPMAGLIHLTRGMLVLTPRDMIHAVGFYNMLLRSCA